MAFDREKYNRVFWENRNSWLYAIARDTRLSASAVRVALLFGTFVNAWDREWVSPGGDWIRKTAGIKSKTTLAQCIKELEDNGYINIIRLRHLKRSYGMPFDGEAAWVPPSNEKTAEFLKVQNMDL